MLNAKIKRSTSGSFGKYCTATIAFLNVGREHNDLIVVRRHARMPLIAILRCNSRGRGRISWGSSERGRAGPMGERRESLMPVRHAAVWWNRHRHIRWRHTRWGHIRWGTFCGGTFCGGALCGGALDGGTKDGGTFCGGALCGGALDGGTFCGGTFCWGAFCWGALDGGTKDGGTVNGGT